MNREVKTKPKIKDIFKAFLRILNWTYKANKVAFPLLALFMVIISILPFAENFINSKVIDEITALIQVPTGNQNLDLLIKFIAVAVVLSLSERLIWALIALVEKIHIFGVGRYIELAFLKKATTMDMYHYENPETNNLIQKVKDIYSYKPRDMSNRAVWMLGDVVRIISSMVIVLTFSPIAFLIVFATTIPSLIINFKLGEGSWGIWDANISDRRRYWWTKDMLAKESSLMELRIFRTKDYLLDIVQNIYDTFTNKERKNDVRRAFIESITGNLSTIGTLIFWVIAIFATLRGEITIGLLTFYVSAIGRFSDGLSNLFRSVSKQYEDSLYLIDFFKFMDLKNQIVIGETKLAEDKKAPLISFKNVGFKYPNSEKYVLKDFNLEINPGEKIAFVGVNGAGKTTIIKLLCRFYDTTEGAILIDGVDIKDLDLDTWYKKIGVLFQDFVRYSQFDVKKNIELGDIDKVGDEKQVVEAIFKADAKFIDDYKNKLEQILDKSFEGGINPSGGQWQRIALARAFFRDAPILILDEPTSAIDAKGEFEIFERLYEFSQNKTVLIVSHRFSTVRRADKIYVIEHGRIVEAGTHHELLKINGKYADAFNTQAEGYK